MRLNSRLAGNPQSRRRAHADRQGHPALPGRPVANACTACDHRRVATPLLSTFPTYRCHAAEMPPRTVHSAANLGSAEEAVAAGADITWLPLALRFSKEGGEKL